MRIERILEGIQIMSEYMGYKIDQPHRLAPHGQIWGQMTYQQYPISWEWLMPVVKKLSVDVEKHWKHLDLNHLRIGHHVLDSAFDVVKINHSDYETYNEGVFKLVISGIQWLNSENKKQK